MNLCIVIISLAIMGYTTAFRQPPRNYCRPGARYDTFSIFLPTSRCRSRIQKPRSRQRPPPFQATLPKARSAKSRVTMSMPSPGGNNDDGHGGTTNQKSRVTMSSPGGDNDDGGGKTAIEKSDATILYNFAFKLSVTAGFCVGAFSNHEEKDVIPIIIIFALGGNGLLIYEPIECPPIGTIQPDVSNAAVIFAVCYLLWSTIIGT